MEDFYRAPDGGRGPVAHRGRVRVAHVITRLCRGGAQENTFQTVRLANADRFEVDLISGPTAGPEGSIEDAVAAAGIPILREPLLLRRPAPWADYLTYRRLCARFRARRYDIVHTHTSKAGILGRAAAAQAGVTAVVHTPHGNVFHGYFSPAATRFYVALERWAAKRTDRIIELTAGGIDEHLAQGIGRREQYRVVFSGIGLAPFAGIESQRAAMRAGLGLGAETLALGCIGRLEPVKGFRYAVAAMAQLAAAGADARLLIAGAGSEDAALRAQAAPLGDRVRFLGPRDDVPALMSALDLLLVPSINEGMGRVVIEAGAAGLPVVASRAGGIPDVVDDGATGLLVAPRDAAALAEAVLALARDAGRRAAMGAAARAKVVPHFGVEHMVSRIEAIYEEVLHEKARNPRR